MPHDDKYIEILRQTEDDEPIPELERQYYNLMGSLLFKQEYVDAMMINKDFNKLLYYVMKMNVSNKH